MTREHPPPTPLPPSQTFQELTTPLNCYVLCTYYKEVSHLWTEVSHLWTVIGIEFDPTGCPLRDTAYIPIFLLIFYRWWVSLTRLFQLESITSILPDKTYFSTHATCVTRRLTSNRMKFLRKGAQSMQVLNEMFPGRLSSLCGLFLGVLLFLLSKFFVHKNTPIKKL